MYEFLDGLHRALHIEATWKFVLLVALVGAIAFGATAWIIDAAYKHSPEYISSHQLLVHRMIEAK